MGIRTRILGIVVEDGKDWSRPEYYSPIDLMPIHSLSQLGQSVPTESESTAVSVSHYFHVLVDLAEPGLQNTTWISLPAPNDESNELRH